MASSTATPPVVNPTPVNPTVAQPLDPWAEPPRYVAGPEQLPFGVRIRHRVIPGTWKVVRAAERMDSLSRYAIRVREVADNGSLIGPVLSWTLDQVAEIVTPEKNVADSAVVSPAPTAPAPPAVSMVITIGQAGYRVTPLPLAFDATRAYRLTKADATAYDLEETADGVSCDCPDWTFRRDSIDPLGCKHIRAARAVGLFSEIPSNVEIVPHSTPAPEPVDAEVAELIADGGYEEADGEGPLAHADAEVFAAVAAGRAEFAREPGMVPSPGFVTRANADDLMAEEAIDGGWASRPKGYHEGLLAQVGCCDPAELLPCSVCLNPTPEVSDEPTDEGDWEDDHIWTIGPDPDRLTLAEFLDDQADRHRKVGGDHHTWLAGKIAELAERARFLGASTPGDFDDREAAMLDAVATR